MSSFKNSSNSYLISKLALRYIVQGLAGTREKIANSASDKIIKYGKFEFIPLVLLHHEFFITSARTKKVFCHCFSNSIKEIELSCRLHFAAPLTHELLRFICPIFTTSH